MNDAGTPLSRPAVCRFDSLADRERLLVWSVRYAHACREAGRDPLPMLLDVHRRNGSESTAIEVLRLVAAPRCRGCAIRCTACPVLSRDEKELLRVLRVAEVEMITDDATRHVPIAADGER